MFSFIACITVIFSILLFAVQYSVINNNTSYTEQQTIKLIEAKSAETGMWFFNVASELRVLSELPTFKSMDVRGIQPIMEALGENYNHYNHKSIQLFGVGGLDGKSWVNANETLQILPREDFLKLIDADSEYIITNPISIPNSENMYMIYLPIYGYTNEKIGMLYGGIPSNQIINMLSDISPNGGITWIMDKNNEIISHNNNYFYNKIISYEKLSSSASNIADKNSGIFETENQLGNKSTVIYSLIPYTDNWKLCTIIENSQIHSHTQSIMNTIILFWLILIIASIFISIKLSKNIVVPLEKLTKNMKNFENGNHSPIKLEGQKYEFYYLSQTYNNMTEKISQLFDEILQEQERARKSELRALQSQINPHFLYNTLDTMKWMAMDYGADDIQNMLTSLSTFFRISLSDGKEIISVQEEIEHAKNYLDIQHTRYSDIMDYEIKIEEAVKSVPTLKLMVQPLVENALYHGLKPKGNAGIISIHAKLQKGNVVISVADNGVGITDNKLKELRQNIENITPTDHYGIFNIAERLRVKYGKNSAITIDSSLGVGTTVTIIFPSNIPEK